MAATTNGTRGYFERIKGKSFKPGMLGSTELYVSKIGFGGYRIHQYEPDHRQALTEALTGGCNIIDTSANYTDGSSEKLIGEVTSELFESGQLRREEIVFVTKAGYVQGQNLADAKNRKSRGSPYPDMVEFQPDCWHNISPEYLESQITKSLERLRIETIDVLLLHNPEYFLKGGGGREAYYQRIERAFRHLESECEKGRVRYYGISSNTLPESEAKSDFTSLQRIVEIAQSISKTNRFAVIQCPFNLFESGAAVVRNNKQETVLEFAGKAKLGVLVNRPFNAFHRGRLVRLTSFPAHDEVGIKGSLHAALGRAIELERQAPGYPKVPQGFQWAQVLRDKMGDLDDVLAWREALYSQIFPSIRQALARVPQEQQSWVEEYQSVMQEFLGLVTADLENLANQKSKIIEEQVVSLLPDLSSTPTLSQKMIRLYSSLPQISSILVGMRTPAYVTDVMKDLKPVPAAKALEALDKLQPHRS